MARRICRLLAALFALSLVAAACGDDDGTSGDDTTRTNDTGDVAGGDDDSTSDASGGTDDSEGDDAGATTVVAFDAEAGEFPEGVAVDSGGNVYVSLSPLGQLVRIAVGSSTPEVVGQIEGLGEGDFGLIGLAADDGGVVYGGVFSANPDAHGVWAFDTAEGTAERIAGSEGIAFPNAVAVDGDVIYMSDTIGADGAGAVYRSVDGGPAELWAQDPLLAGTGALEFGFPLGANGIDVHDGTVYVGVTETALVVTIPIESDGTAGTAEQLIDLSDADPAGGLVVVDGIDVADDGTVYVSSPAVHTILIVARDGTVTSAGSADDGLDVPTSAVVHDGVLYIVNFSAALEAFANGNGPSLVSIPVS